MRAGSRPLGRHLGTFRPSLQAVLPISTCLGVGILVLGALLPLIGALFLETKGPQLLDWSLYILFFSSFMTVVLTLVPRLEYVSVHENGIRTGLCTSALWREITQPRAESDPNGIEYVDLDLRNSKRNLRILLDISWNEAFQGIVEARAGANCPT